MANCMSIVERGSMGESRKGAGTIYRRGSGYWAVAVELPREDGRRRRKVKTSKDRAVVEAFLQEWREANPLPEARNRSEHMAAARALGTHRPSEVEALIRATADCRYCRVVLSEGNRVVDHIIPVSRGGSDAIGNLQVICWECNADKRDRLDYRWDGPPRPVKQSPWVRPYEPLDPEIARKVLRRIRGY